MVKLILKMEDNGLRHPRDLKKAKFTCQVTKWCFFVLQTSRGLGSRGRGEKN